MKLSIAILVAPTTARVARGGSRSDCDCFGLTLTDANCVYLDSIED